MKRATILLADDHTLMTDGLRKLLEPHFHVLGSVEDGRQLLVAAAELQPDVVVLDISMPGLNGIEAAGKLKRTLPRTKLVFLTMYADPTYVSRAMATGASGYVLKHCAAAELVIAIENVLRGGCYVSEKIDERFPTCNPEAAQPLDALTSREREVLQLVAEGRSGKEIAGCLGVSPKTVAFHKTNIMRKLGIHNTAGLTKLAIQKGITE